jgi:hypothetical protein
MVVSVGEDGVSDVTLFSGSAAAIENGGTRIMIAITNRASAAKRRKICLVKVMSSSPYLEYSEPSRGPLYTPLLGESFSCLSSTWLY